MNEPTEDWTSEQDRPPQQDGPPEEERDAGQATPAGGVTPLRIVLFAILGISIVMLLIDRRGRMAAQSAMTDITALMPEDPTEIEIDAVTEEEVRKVVGREPDNRYEGPSGRLVEEYRWKGLFNREYVVYVSYQQGVINLLHSVTLNDKSDL